MRRKTRKVNYYPLSKLRVIREKKGYNQAYMAERLGYSQVWYSKVELGKFETLGSERLKIARILGCKVSDLFTPQSKKPIRIYIQSTKNERK